MTDLSREQFLERLDDLIEQVASGESKVSQSRVSVTGHPKDVVVIVTTPRLATRLRQLAVAFRLVMEPDDE